MWRREELFSCSCENLARPGLVFGRRQVVWGGRGSKEQKGKAQEQKGLKMLVNWTVTDKWKHKHWTSVLSFSVWRRTWHRCHSALASTRACVSSTSTCRRKGSARSPTSGSTAREKKFVAKPEPWTLSRKASRVSGQLTWWFNQQAHNERSLT